MTFLVRRAATSLAQIGVLVAAMLLTSCRGALAPESVAGGPKGAADESVAGATGTTSSADGSVTFAFAGDVHFEGALSGVAGQRGSDLGALSQVLGDADLAMVNLESAVGGQGSRTSKEREDPSRRYWFRSPASALGTLARSGVDVVSMANNHGADYGERGLRESIRIAQRSDLAVVGIGRHAAEAFRPSRTSVRGTDVAVLAADASPRESDDPIWSVGPGSGPGVASARNPRAPRLAAAVREAARSSDVVVVYLHWGDEGDARPTDLQQRLARTLAKAGADIVVGTHAHVQLGAGMLGRTYVSFGLGNFYWYHGNRPATGVLTLRVAGGEVVGEEWSPGRIPPGGGAPIVLRGVEADQATSAWRSLRRGTGLRPGPGDGQPVGGGNQGGESSLPAFTSVVRRIGPDLRRTMRSSHDAAFCPLPLAALRHLTLTYVGFDGRAHRGQLIVNAAVVPDVVAVFEALYRSRFPIEQMRLVDDFGGDDAASMAANNTSAYNCRTVAGTSTFSDHAYGLAIDINPVQNPYVVGDDVRPLAGQAFVTADRSESAPSRQGVIRDGDVVRRAFARVGWAWGGDYTDPDFQHFSAP